MAAFWSWEAATDAGAGRQPRRLGLERVPRRLRLKFSK